VHVAGRLAPPLHRSPIRIRQPHRPQKNDALSVNGSKQCLAGELPGQFRQKLARDDVLFTFALEFEHRRVHAVIRTGMNTHKVLLIRLAHRHRGQQLFDAGGVDEVLTQPKIVEIKRIRWRTLADGA